MTTILDDSLFSEEHTLSLYHLFHEAFTGRHYILLENDDPESRGRQWIESQPAQIQIRIELVLDKSVTEFYHKRPTLVFKVFSDDGAGLCAADPTHVRIGDIGQYLRQRVQVFVEDNINDRAFLLAVATIDQRTEIEKAESLDLLEFKNGGGISNMHKALESLVNNKVECSFSFALFDSDAVLPGALGRDSLKILSICQTNGIRHYCLRRRNAENYLCLAQLFDWARRRNRKERIEMLSKCQSLKSLTEVHRHHYHLREGFRKDLAIVASESPIWKSDWETRFNAIPESDRQTLERGFGNIQSLFAEFPPTEKHLNDEGSATELRPVIDTILSLL